MYKLLFTILSVGMNGVNMGIKISVLFLKQSGTETGRILTSTAN